MKIFPSLFHTLWRFILIHFYNEYTIADFYRKTQDVVIGNNCRIIGKRIRIFGSEPYLVEIGNNVTITEDVKFITHDGGVAIFRKGHPSLNVFGRIIIKNNCFIGVNSILMPNITIGPNSVVGAGSVVTRDIPENTVAAGVPAKPIMSIADYKQKSLQRGMVLSSHDAEIKKELVLSHLDTI